VQIFHRLQQSSLANVAAAPAAAAPSNRGATSFPFVPPPPPVPSHLSSFPPPLGGANPTQLLSSAQATAQVSQSSHTPHTTALNYSPVSGQASVEVNQHFHVNPSSTARQLVSNLSDSIFAGLPDCAKPTPPSLSTKPPKTVDELRNVLDDWFYNDDDIQHDRVKANAVTAYCNKTIKYAYEAGAAQAFLYHLEAVKAATRRPHALWDPVTGGDTYFPARHQYIDPFVNGSRSNKSSSSRTAGKENRRLSLNKKRTAPAEASSDPADPCSWTGHRGHTNGECKVQAAAKRAKTTAVKDWQARHDSAMFPSSAVPSPPPAALRDSHEPVQPPVPLFSPPSSPLPFPALSSLQYNKHAQTPSCLLSAPLFPNSHTTQGDPSTAPLLLNTLADVTAPAAQHLWHSTIDLMEREDGADINQLDRIRRWITSGVTLELLTPPACIDHDNTFSVVQHADAVRARIQEYIAFEAITPLSADHPCPFGIQPLHVIIKAGKKPRLVIDLSRNLNDNLEYEYFSYSSVREAAELSTPNCWYGKPLCYVGWYIWIVTLSTRIRIAKS
jgi:hypothetical protein